MLVTIHQPDFMPWFGFFNKISKADLWVVLDHVINNPRDATYLRRVKIIVNGHPHWLSIPLKKPIEKGVLGIPINQMTFNNQCGRMANCLETVRRAYKKSYNYEKYKSLTEDYFLSNQSLLMVRNMDFIIKVFEILSIKTKIVYSSSLNICGSRNQLLLNILKEVGAKKYLCGTGAYGYQDDNLFHEEGIQVEYNSFEFPKYKHLLTQQQYQGVSILDSLFQMDSNCLKEKLFT